MFCKLFSFLHYFQGFRSSETNPQILDYLFVYPSLHNSRVTFCAHGSELTGIAYPIFSFVDLHSFAVPVTPPCSEAKVFSCWADVDVFLDVIMKFASVKR